MSELRYLASIILCVPLVVGCGGKKPTDTDMSGVTDGVEIDDGMTTETIDPDVITNPIEPAGIDEGALGDRLDLGDIYFNFDQYDIRADQRPTLERNAQMLRARPGWRITIEGHCDERGTEEYNLVLGDRRANAAREYLLSLGVSSERMSTISYGEAYPVDPRQNESAWAKNRRAHFVLVPPR